MNNMKIFVFFKEKYFYLFYSLLIVLSLYLLGNFGFFNIFNVKYELTIIVVSVLFLYSFYILMLYKKIHMVSWFLLYLFISSLFLNVFYFNYTIKLLLLFFVINCLFLIEIKYIEIIIKTTIFITGIFSFIGIGLFIFYYFNGELLNSLERVFKSYDTFIDLSDLPFHQKFGFVIEKAERNFLGLQYIRSRSYCSEPSLSIPLFFAIGILSMSYKKWFKYIGIIILFFAVILIYSASAIVSLILSMFFIIGMYCIRENIHIKAFLIILLVHSGLILLFFINISIFNSITPESKLTSLSSRVFTIQEGISSLILNPFWNTENFNNSFISMLITFSGGIPLLGVSLISYFFYKLFLVAIKLYPHNKLFIALLCGLLIQIILFSSGAWTSFPGIVILVLIYRYLENKSLNE
ncbi:O-antigen polymerase [Aliarcobacter butzleri]|uniref:O-antigen polymerase n=1 Tax=Aliarcobacter butzleri TaxID=28197 RepID=UPI003AF4E4CE